jgi:membrane-bound serine protease (ClpP class)
MLFDPAGPDYQVSLSVALAVGGAMALITLLVVVKIVQARRRPAQTGQEELVGELGIVRSALQPSGLVFVHGEIWRAHTGGDPIPAGATIRVEAIEDGLVLVVRPVDELATVSA